MWTKLGILIAKIFFLYEISTFEIKKNLPVAVMLCRCKCMLVDRRWVISYLKYLFSHLDKQSDVHPTEWVSAYRWKYQAPISGLFPGSGFCTCIFSRQHSKAIWLFSQHLWQIGMRCGHVSGLPWYTKACCKNGKIMLCIFNLLDFFNRAAHLLFHTQESVCLYLDFTWVHTIGCEQVYLNVWIWRLSKDGCDMKDTFLAIGRKWFGVYVDFVLIGCISLWKKPLLSEMDAVSDLPFLRCGFIFVDEGAGLHPCSFKAWLWFLGFSQMLNG